MLNCRINHPASEMLCKYSHLSFSTLNPFSLNTPRIRYFTSTKSYVVGKWDRLNCPSFSFTLPLSYVIPTPMTKPRIYVFTTMCHLDYTRWSYSLSCSACFNQDISLKHVLPQVNWRVHNSLHFLTLFLLDIDTLQDHNPNKAKFAACHVRHRVKGPLTRAYGFPHQLFLTPCSNWHMLMFLSEQMTDLLNAIINKWKHLPKSYSVTLWEMLNYISLSEQSSSSVITCRELWSVCWRWHGAPPLKYPGNFTTFSTRLFALLNVSATRSIYGYTIHL